MPSTYVNSTQGALIEAQDYDRVQTGDSPSIVSVTGPSTGTIDAIKGVSNTVVDYDITFTQAGTYRVWLRADSDGVRSLGSSISLAGGGLNMLSTASKAVLEPEMRWVGSGGYSAAVAEFTITAPGTQRLSLGLLNSGVKVDEIYIAPDTKTRPGDAEAVSSLKFVDSIGINTHLHYYNTSYGDLNRVSSALDYLGVHHIRDTSPQGYTKLARLNALVDKGYDLTLALGDTRTFSIKEQLDWVKRVKGDGLEAIEGPNESDQFALSYGGLSFPYNIRAYMWELSARVEADPILGPAGHNVPIIQASFGRSNSPALVGDLSRYVDYGNAHIYPGRGDAPGTVYERYLSGTLATSPGRPMVATEAGYDTAVNAPYDPYFAGVSESVQAKYITRMVLEQFVHGYERTFLYELLDEMPDLKDVNSQMNYGLFDVSGRPKPAAAALARMIDLLENADPVQSTEGGSLHYTLSGLPATGEDVLLKAGGSSYYLVLWNDADGWNEASRSAISVDTSKVTIQTDQLLSRVIVHNPIDDTHVATFINSTGQGFVVQLSDSPLIVEVKLPSTTAAETTSARISSIGTTSVIQQQSAEAAIAYDPAALDTSSTRIIVNAKGIPAGFVNAHFNLLIDGKVLGEGMAEKTAKNFVFTANVTADHAHKVQVAFDNDLNVGGMDCNLIVNKVTINGNAILPTASFVTYDKGTLDGKNVSAGQSNLFWNGALVIDADKSYFPTTKAATFAAADAGNKHVDTLLTGQSQSAATVKSALATVEHAVTNLENPIDNTDYSVAAYHADPGYYLYGWA
jgi:hypothetical protein